MVLFNSALGYNFGMSAASLAGLREMANEQKYPHIVAAMRDLKQEILRSSGVDPNNPNAPPGIVTGPRHVNIKDLPPPMTKEEKAAQASEGMVFGSGAGYNGDHAPDNSMEQYSFGNPGLQQTMEDSPPQSNAAAPGADASAPAWESVRKANSTPDNAWSKIRKQGSSQKQQQQQQKPGSEGGQLANAWDRLGGGQQSSSDEGSFASGDASWAPRAPALSSDEFPRSREDFEEATRQTTTKYGDAVYR
ncbi:hypothetical protein IWW38_005757 [Coemansia aciculifera]|uniref:Uncharacterized protein n=1 Tax=Coemansia aciculifera TaxID=417176 RepID=A0ACC1LVN2_9FUNG|nr:hypothetical protein IWW38_005757 [Coemansia aciculifera]